MHNYVTKRGLKNDYRKVFNKVLGKIIGLDGLHSVDDLLPKEENDKRKPEYVQISLNTCEFVKEYPEQNINEQQTYK